MAEFYAERRANRLPVNSIFLGRVKEFSPSLRSYFINIGLSRNAFLSIDDLSSSPENGKTQLKKGDEVFVQLVKPPYRTKGARVSLSISLPGHYIVYFPEAKRKFVNVSKRIEEDQAQKMKEELESLIKDNCGIIVRTAALDTDYGMILKELEHLKEKWESIKHLAHRRSAPVLLHSDDSFAVRVIREAYREEVEEVYVDSENAYREILSYAEKFIPKLSNKLKLYRNDKPLFEKFSAEGKLREIFSRTVTLPSGGYIVIDKREAMTVIDVNSGRYAGPADHESMALQVNLEAADEVARQLRLRNISGIIVVDFVDTKSEESKNTLVERFSKLMERDRASTSFEFVPSMSLLIITRKYMPNVAASFYEEECGSCHGSGWLISKSALAASVLRKIKKVAKSKIEESIVFHINTKVLQAIKEEFSDSIEDIEKETKKNIYLVGTETVNDDDYEIVISGKDELIRQHFPAKIMFTK